MLADFEGRLAATWRRSDEIFELIDPEALHDQPISLRHPLLFYLGHLPAFAWNQVCRGVLGRPSFHAEFDELFERGIDPIGVDDYQSATNWPAVAEVLEYRDRVRSEILGAFGAVAERAASDPLAKRGRIFAVAIEHEEMHQETLQYMFQRLPLERKRRPADLALYLFDAGVSQSEVEVQGGRETLGARFDDLDFGWDNEFPELEVEVADFRIDRLPVRISEYLEFVEAAGYDRPELWQPSDWEWRQRNRVERPAFWSRTDDGWSYQAMFDRLDLARVGGWPVSVSLAEARTYCRWRGRRLPTEAEVHRAAYATPDGGSRPFPWGDAAPAAEHGNFDFSNWAPTPIGSHPAGDSAWGVAELVGNGWEWTDTVFGPFPGFEAYIPSYAGYSTDFFDGLHYVMLGASWATPVGLIRRSFRNWFQGHYPYMFAKFRCAR